MTDPALVGQVYETYGLPGYPADRARYAVVTAPAGAGKVLMTTFTTDKHALFKPGSSIPLDAAAFPTLFRSRWNPKGLPPVPGTHIGLHRHGTGEDVHFECHVAASINRINMEPPHDGADVRIGDRVCFRIDEPTWNAIRSACPASHADYFAPRNAIS